MRASQLGAGHHVRVDDAALTFAPCGHDLTNKERCGRGRRRVLLGDSRFMRGEER